MAEVSMADAVGRLMQTTKTRQKRVASLDKIRKVLDEKCYRRAVAGDAEYERACQAVKAAHDSERGLFIIGKCGRGKTQLMRALYALNYDRPAKWLYVKEGPHINWMRDVPNFYNDKNVFVDDVGSESDLREYGMTIDVVGDFIQHYHAKGIGRFYGTTNLSPEALNERYGMRCLSRIMEMCVLLEMTGNDKRERIVYAANKN